MKNLIERLRRYKRDRSGYAKYCHQAADALEQQAAVIETMREDAFKAGFEFCENLTSTEVLNKVKADARREGMLAAAEICDDTDQEYEPVTGEPRRLNYSCGKAIREAAK